MSLEAALAENTAALKALSAQLAAGAAAAPKGPVSETLDRVEKVVNETSKPASGKTTTAKKAAAAPAKEEPKQEPGIAYDDLRAEALKLADKKGRDALVAINQKFGVKSAQELKPEQYAKYLEAVRGALADAEEESLV